MALRAGIIGTGGVAGLGLLGMHDEAEIGERRVPASHAGGYAASDAVDLVAAADVDREQLATFSELWGIPEDARYESHGAMLEAESLDVVSVCTPTLFHRDHVVDAAASAAAPDAIWCEKPIASSVTGAEAMIEACDDAGAALVVNHTSRFTPSMRRLRDLLDERELLGEVRSIDASFRMELVRNSTHLLDTVVYLTDLDARHVSGWVTGENEAEEALDATAATDDAGGSGMIVLENGAVFQLDCTIPREISTMAYRFLGTEGRIEIDVPGGEWRYWTVEDGAHVERPLDVDPEPDDYARGFANAADHVAALARGDAENESSGREALRSLEAIVAMFVSDSTGARVTLPLDRPLRDVEVRSW